MKNKGVFECPSAQISRGGMRFWSNVPVPEDPVINPPPCNNEHTDRRAMPIGMNKFFAPYWQCREGVDPGCQAVWDPCASNPANCDSVCASQYINHARIREAAKMVVLTDGVTSCSGGGGYWINVSGPVNSLFGISGRPRGTTSLSQTDTANGIRFVRPSRGSPRSTRICAFRPHSTAAWCRSV